MEPEAWLARAGHDDVHIHALYDAQGEKVSYEELLSKADPSVLSEIDTKVLWERHHKNQAAVAKIREAIAAEKPDVILVIGDDHKEVFQDDNMPAISLYWGETLPYKPQGMMKWKYSSELKAADWYPQEECEYPVASDLAKRMIGQLMDRDFDVAHSKYYKPEQGMSHSFGYVYYKMLGETPIPIIPVSINTYYPPNQISPTRAFRLGQAIREAVATWPEDIKVAVIATGGLSHFVVDEAFDKAFLDVMANGTADDHGALPLKKLQSGNSEFRCWSALAGAVTTMQMELVDYVPCYRSPAGTGCAMAFAIWR